MIDTPDSDPLSEFAYPGPVARNPAFDCRITFEIEDGAVTGEATEEQTIACAYDFSLLQYYAGILATDLGFGECSTHEIKEADRHSTYDHAPGADSSAWIAVIDPLD